MSRRARIQPTEVGLLGSAVRRTPGLRREEVAVLAGVGPSWYQWLEQGRDIAVSPQVLDSVARVLKLSDVERRHLYVLADLNPPLPATAATPDSRAVLERLTEAWLPHPAHVMDIYWNIVAHNEAARLAFGFTEGDTNCMVSFFADDAYRNGANDSAGIAESIVAYYRAAAAGYPEDEGFPAVVAKASRASPEFARLWARGDVGVSGQMLKEYAHPVAGPLRFESTQLQIPARPDLTLVLHNPRDADTRRRLDRLLSGDAAGHPASARPA